MNQQNTKKNNSKSCGTEKDAKLFCTLIKSIFKIVISNCSKFYFSSKFHEIFVRRRKTVKATE